MSSAAESARAANKAKAQRMAAGDPHAQVDASGYSPDGPMHADAATGMRPVSRRAFKRGGGVLGEAAEARADRKPRKSGGALTATSLINRDVKEANKERGGEQFTGGMKRGGRAGKTMGGLALPTAFTPVSRADGGRTHADGCECAKCGGGRVGRDTGGRAPMTDPVMTARKGPASPTAQAVAGSAMKMASKKGVDPYNSQPTQAKAYNQLWNMRGGRPGRAEGGKINDGTRPTGGRLARKGGGRTKKGTNVNVIIMPSGAGATPPPMAGPPPGAGPLGMRQGVPPPAPMPPPGAGAPPPMPMGRKDGGRTNFAKPGSYPIDTGSGGGLGRLEKAQRAARG